MRARGWWMAAAALVAIAPQRAQAQTQPQQDQARSSAVDRLRTSSSTSQRPRRDTIELRFRLQGEVQTRVVGLSDIPLATTPGFTTPSSLGQNAYFEFWLRFTPQFHVGERLRFIGQIDLPRGVPLGQFTQQVEPSQDARSGVITVSPRWLYVEMEFPFGLIRLGQQGFYWGLGMLSNDGNHTNVFGDYRLGDIVERVAFATRPFGKNTDLVAAVAGDLVFRDRLATLYTLTLPTAGTPGASPPRIVGGDLAIQAVASAFYQQHDCKEDCERKRVGAIVAYRNQTSRSNETLELVVVDVAGRWEWPTPDPSTLLFAAAEVAGVFGSTTVTRSVWSQRSSVVQFGALGQLGLERKDRFKLTLEAGVASGDGQPFDSSQTRFTFNSEHRVGLLLFPELMAWQSARAAAIAIDPRWAAVPPGGTELLPTNGGVSGAAYLYPTAVVNLHPRFDLRAGMVVAAATSENADPVYSLSEGRVVNARGGSARARDLGLEFDLGAMGRIPLSSTLELHLGAQGGVLFPGHAFDDAQGRAMPVLGLIAGRVGLGF